MISSVHLDGVQSAGDTDLRLKVVDALGFKISESHPEKPSNEARQQIFRAYAEEDNWRKRSIYRIPPLINDMNPRAYTPRTASFGPYYNGYSHLMAMEEHKVRALLHFLKRSGMPLHHCVATMSEVLDDVMASYHPLPQEWSHDKSAFMQLMILDGCFILEVLRMGCLTTEDDYAENDPVFSAHGRQYVIPHIKRDMLMLENQLPMLVLVKLLEAETGPDDQKDGDSLNKIIISFFHQRPFSNIGKCLHVLDVYRKSLIYTVHRTRRHRPRWTVVRDNRIRSATELYGTGIRFQRSKSTSLQDITFSTGALGFRNGVLCIPTIVVDDHTESTFLNLIAFERLHVGTGNEVTSYIVFMDCIIDNANDVALLNSKGIIQNAIGSNKAVANLFNSLSKDTALNPDSGLDMVFEEINQYCMRPWNMSKDDLFNIFRKPLVILSLIFSSLTLVQTVYTVLQYYQQK